MSGRKTCRPASGRFVLRMHPELHEALRKAADSLGMSLNDYCTRKLAAPVGNPAVLNGATGSIARAAELFGADLLGIVVFGSWVRDELTDRSDVDLLVVLESRLPLTRSLYRTWDQAPVTWENRPVEPHFVHLPAPGERVGGIWAEAALEGVVLLETGLRLSSRLSLIRRDIVCGRIVRGLAHGHPYWKKEA
jgi:hypothetical protein